MECLDANAVQDLMAGALDDDARSLAIVHLDTCADCRDLISLLARDATRDAAVDTLRDTDKGAPDIAMLETVASGSRLPSVTDALAATAAPGAASDDAALAETGAVTSQTRIRAPSYSYQQLGKYALAERLGAGAMGVVYRAEDPGLGRSVALKLLHRPDPALTDRLIREARSMAQVNHPNVVAVYDVGVADGTTYIAMELVSGGSLRAWQHEPRTIQDVIEIYVAAGRGLAAAHAAGIVHRDFKPDNVLIGSDGRARVTDFGLAAARKTDGDDTSTASDDLSLTRSGTVLGTPAYMAPEQFTGGHVDARTDQFNFCVALYEALYQQRPFSGKTFEELGNAVCNGQLAAAPEGSRVSGALRAIILRGLSVKPGDRYPTMDHLLAELGRDRAKPWRRTSIAAAVLAAVLGLGLVADLVARDRVELQIREAFAATGWQTRRAFAQLARSFDAAANAVYFQPLMRKVSGTREQADFGLGSPDEDRAHFEELHQELASTSDFEIVREIAGGDAVIAVTDYKGRLLYTSAAPAHWRVDLARLPWVKSAFDGKSKSIVIVPTTDKQLVDTGLLGPRPVAELAVFFTRTLILAGEAGSQLLVIVDARNLLTEIQQDAPSEATRTRISVVASTGAAVGDVPPPLLAAASLDGTDIVDIDLDGTRYQMQAQPLAGFDGQTVGHVVMARPMTAPLSLFPGARAVFAAAMLAMLALAIATALRARRLAGAT